MSVLNKQSDDTDGLEGTGSYDYGSAWNADACNKDVPIKFHDLAAQYRALKLRINERIKDVLDHGQYILGPEVEELEQKLETYTGARHCVSVSSGTDALLITLMAIGVKSGEEVITTPFTFVSTAEVIARLGAIPVFVDIEPDTYNINPALIKSAITSKTRAIIPVALYGQPADMDDINSIAAEHGLVVIEDAAQSFGSVYRDKHSCNLSTVGCTSFFPSKPLGCYGDGGAIFTNNDDLAGIMHEIRIHGQARRYHHARLGVGGRMDTLQCAVLLAKLERFNWELERRNEIAQYYCESIENIESVFAPVVRKDRTSAWAQYTIRVRDRDHTQENLRRAGVPTAVHYPMPLARQPAFKGTARIVGELLYSEAAAREVLSLPMHPYLEQVTQGTIVTALAKAVGK